MGIRRQLRENRNKIVSIIVIIIIGFLLIQILNSIAKKRNEENSEMTPSLPDSLTAYETGTTYSPLAEESIPKSQTNKNNAIITSFIEYNNKKEYDKAYELLTEECKKELFPTIENYINQYGVKIFNDEKTHSIQYIGTYNNADTYKVRIISNPLSTGIYDNSNAVEDYYTIVIDKQDNTKLNISKFIQKQELNKSIGNNNISLIVLAKYIYVDYERYEIKMENNTNKTILLNSGEKSDTVYGTDENGTKYTGFMYELTINEIKVEPNFAKTVKIKYNKQFNTNKTIQYLMFSDIILDYDEYKQILDKQEYTNRKSIQIGI